MKLSKRRAPTKPDIQVGSRVRVLRYNSGLSRCCKEGVDNAEVINIDENGTLTVELGCSGHIYPSVEDLEVIG